MIESDLAFLETLPLAAQRDLLEWHAQMEAIDKASRHGPKLVAVQAAAVILGVSDKTVYRRHDQWELFGIRALVDRRKVSSLVPVPETAVGQRQPFIKYWKALCERGGKHSISRAYNDLLQQWREGNDIPGYDSPPPAGHSGHPIGWSLKNLTRIYNKSRSFFPL